MKEQNDKRTCFSVAASDQNMSYTMYKYLLWEKRASWVTFSLALSPFLLPEALLVPIPLPHSLRVSGSLACSVQAAVTKCRGPGGLNNRHLFFTVLEAGISKFKVRARNFTLQPPLGLQVAAILPCAHRTSPWCGAWRESKLSTVSVIPDYNPIRNLPDPHPQHRWALIICRRSHIQIPPH